MGRPPREPVRPPWMTCVPESQPCPQVAAASLRLFRLHVGGPSANNSSSMHPKWRCPFLRVPPPTRAVWISCGSALMPSTASRPNNKVGNGLARDRSRLGPKRNSRNHRMWSCCSAVTRNLNISLRLLVDSIPGSPCHLVLCHHAYPVSMAACLPAFFRPTFPPARPHACVYVLSPDSSQLFVAFPAAFCFVLFHAVLFVPLGTVDAVHRPRAAPAQPTASPSTAASVFLHRVKMIHLISNLGIRSF